MKTIIEYAQKFENDPLVLTYSLFIPPGEKLYKQQEEIIESAVFEPETYVKSYHSAGKTFTTALAVLTFLFVKIPSKIISTAPSWTQVEKLLWAEINTIYKKSHERMAKKGIIISNNMPLTTEFKLDDEWFALGVSPKLDKGQDAKRMTGFHSDHLLFVMDEGPAVDPRIWTIKDTILTGQDMHGLYIGNPVDSSGDFYKGFQDSANKRITLNIFENPNFVANGVKSIDDLKKIARLMPDKRNKLFNDMKYPFPFLATPKWAMGRGIKWGWDSPLFKSRVLSEFPDQASDALISLGLLESCRNIDTDMQNNVLSCDPARFGDDDTVILGTRRGKEIYKDRVNGINLMDTANKLIYLFNQNKSNPKEKYHVIVIDEVGIGAGIIDYLKQHFSDVTGAPRIIGVNNGSKPSKDYEDTCSNLVTELFLRTKKLLEYKNISIQDTGTVFAELTNRKYKFTTKGLMQVESKDEYKERTGSGSPDEGDAVLLNIYGMTIGQQKTVFKSIGNMVTSDQDF